MRVLISGSTGFVGNALLGALLTKGHDVCRLVRPSTRIAAPASGSTPPVLTWDPIAGTLDPAANGAEAVIHLAGASIADRRWTAARKQILRDSRIGATRQLVSALGRLARPPGIFLAASAIGYYGNRGDETLTEASTSGQDFLSSLCQDWEAESNKARDWSARVVLLRFGIILAKHGGALPRMSLPFRLGLGGRLGSGRQWMSWVSLEDTVGITTHALEMASLNGPVNVVSPNPVRNADFVASLGRALHRPALFPAPAGVLRLVLGEMADSLLLSSQRVVPQTVSKSSYRFAHQDVTECLREIFAG